jgi:hypothetical protein
LTSEAVRRDFPEVYQHVLLNVKELKDKNGNPIGRDVNNRPSYREKWWIFSEPRSEMRPALEGLRRFVGGLSR